MRTLATCMRFGNQANLNSGEGKWPLESDFDLMGDAAYIHAITLRNTEDRNTRTVQVANHSVTHL